MPRQANDLSLPGTERQQATDLLASRFPPQQNGSSPIVFHVTMGKITDTANKQAVESAYKALSKAPHVASAPDPFANTASGLVSKDATTAFTPVLLDIPRRRRHRGDREPHPRHHRARAEGGRRRHRRRQPRRRPVQVADREQRGRRPARRHADPGAHLRQPGGDGHAHHHRGTRPGHRARPHRPARPRREHPNGRTDAGHDDRAGCRDRRRLFLVTKHRDQLARGIERHESIARAVATSGSAIVFAGGTVIIALLSLWLAGIPLVASLGYASAVAVFTAVLAAITLLPAVLSLAGRHLFGAKLPAFLRSRSRPGATPLWSRWAATVTADPLVCGLAALALLVPLILPMFSLHLGQEDIAATPMETTERQAFDLLAREYGPGYNGPLLTATELSPPARPSKAYEDKYNQAKANQADLERKQKSLTAESNSPKSQQALLERQQASSRAAQS